jgi:hypothetical protein
MTAHLKFAGGGLFLPASTPYEREMIREHLLDHLRHEENLQLNIGHKTWLVERSSAEHPIRCGTCKRQLVAALHTRASDTYYCVACALR